MANARRGDGQTALVTGASTGIGLDLAECFARDGYNVIVTARSETPLKELAGRLTGQHNVQAVAIAVDLGQPGGGEKLANEIRSRGLNVDVVVNNAGYGMSGAFDDLSALVAAVAQAARPGDHVLVMSNGGFGGVHQKLLDALGSRPRGAA